MVHQRDVGGDGFFHAGAQYLDDDVFTAVQGSGVDLRDGSGGERGFVEVGEVVFQRLAQGGFDDAARFITGEGWDPVLQFAQFFEQVGTEQVGAGGEGLAEFDEDGAEVLQGETQAFAEGGVFGGIAVISRMQAGGKTQPAEDTFVRQVFVQAVADEDAGDVVAAAGGCEHQRVSLTRRVSRRSIRLMSAARRAAKAAASVRVAQP